MVVLGEEDEEGVCVCSIGEMEYLLNRSPPPVRWEQRDYRPALKRTVDLYYLPFSITVRNLPPHNSSSSRHCTAYLIWLFSRTERTDDDFSARYKFIGASCESSHTFSHSEANYV